MRPSDPSGNERSRSRFASTSSRLRRSARIARPISDSRMRSTLRRSERPRSASTILNTCVVSSLSSASRHRARNAAQRRIEWSVCGSGFVFDISFSFSIPPIARPGEPRDVLERGLRAFFAYVREPPEGHAVLTRDAPIHLSDVGLGVMLDGLAARIGEAIARAIRALGLDPAPAPIYANALIGLGAHVGRWWRDHPEVSLDMVTSHTTTLLWNGFGGMMSDPSVRALLTPPPKLH